MYTMQTKNAYIVHICEIAHICLHCFVTIDIVIRIIKYSGELATIGRATALHAVGCEFESRILHNFFICAHCAHYMLTLFCLYVMIKE